ncbi:MAG: DUF3810 domain-containing protein [Eubacteriales bacterium]|nr:DUF3810 domain-containing protein [Lachnospiraceae bacterium]MDO5126823.1 DUF3810 domain-containing protein [Eubacteriales bacterium]
MYKRLIKWMGGMVIILNIVAWCVPAFCNWYTRYITPIMVNVFGRLMNIFPWSVGEHLLVLFLLISIVFIVILVLYVLFRKRKAFTSFAIRYFKCYSIVVLTVALIMTLNCTIYYHCTPLTAKKGTQIGEYTIDDLEAVRNEIVEKCNYYSTIVNRDENGYVIYDKDMQSETKECLRNLSKDYPKLAGYYPNAKPLASSNLMSQAYIAGYYFPFSMEANYNKNMYICNYPAVLCHEFAHLHGYIYEDEANFIAFRACVESDDPFFIYSGYLSVLNYVEEAYWNQADKDRLKSKKIPLVNDYVIEDNIFLTEAEWKKVNEKAVLSGDIVEQASEKFTDTTIKLNGVKDGMNSYRMVVELLLDYYN